MRNESLGDLPKDSLSSRSGINSGGPHFQAYFPNHGTLLQVPSSLDLSFSIRRDHWWGLIECQTPVCHNLSLAHCTCTVWNKFRLLLLENRLVPSHVCLLSLPNDKNFYTFWMEDISYSFATFTTLSLVLTSDKNSHTSSSEGHKSILTFNLIPSAWVSFCRSDPAKSTKLSREVRMFTVSLLFSIDSIVIVKTAWDLEDSLFIDVDATRLFLHPPDNTWQKENVLSWLLSGHNSH